MCHNPASPHVRESGFRNVGNFCLWKPESEKNLHVESTILGFGIRNTAQRIRNPTTRPLPAHLSDVSRILVPQTKTGIHTWNPESMTWNPESKNVLSPIHGATRLDDSMKSPCFCEKPSGVMLSFTEAFITDILFNEQV